MCQEDAASIVVCFADMEEPRFAHLCVHKLIDIMVIAMCAVICGADNWVEIAGFGRAKYDWLKKFLELPCGIPSHDTFGRVFAVLDPQEFERHYRGTLRYCRARDALYACRSGQHRGKGPWTY